MSAEPAPTNPPAAHYASPPIHEVLAGEMGAKHGALPVVPLPQEDELLISFVHSMGQHLQDKDLFRRDQVIVTPHEMVENGCEKDEKDAAKQGRLVLMEPKMFCSWSQRHVVTSRVKHDKNGEPFPVYKDMSTEVAEKVLVALDFASYMRQIEEVRPVPTPRRAADGEIVLAERGFNDGVFTFNFPGGYHEWDLKKSADFIRTLLAEFPFEDWKDEVLSDESGGDGTPIRQSRSQAVQLAAMLAPFCAGLIPDGANRMGFVFDANSQRSGKTLLAKIAVMPLYGSFKGQPYKSNDETLSKLLDSEMLEGSNYICFDNVKGYLGSQSLEGLMTTPGYTGRVLGKTQMFTVKNRVSLFFTGNGCTLSPDMVHRCLVCRLFVPEGDVQERAVMSIIDEPWLMDLENRRNVLSALWGIVRAWSDAGEPKAKDFGFKPRVGFEQWGGIIGGIVGFAGFGNPLEKEAACDREMRDLILLLVRLEELSLGEHEGEFTAEQITDLCADESLFDYMMEGRHVDGHFKLHPKVRSSFFLMLGRHAPDVAAHGFRPYKCGEKVIRFGRKGEGKRRRYIVEF